MEGKHERNGNCTLKWNPHNGEGKLYSPDGHYHCLPCDDCGMPQWVSPVTVAVLCDVCAKHRDEGE